MWLGFSRFFEKETNWAQSQGMKGAGGVSHVLGCVWWGKRKGGACTVQGAGDRAREAESVKGEGGEAGVRQGDGGRGRHREGMGRRGRGRSKGVGAKTGKGPLRDRRRSCRSSSLKT